MVKRIGFVAEPESFQSSEDNFVESSEDEMNVFSSDDDDELPPGAGFEQQRQREARAADRLSVRLLAIHDDDSEEEDRILRKSLRLLAPVDEDEEQQDMFTSSRRMRQSIRYEQESASKRKKMIWTLVVWALVGLLAVAVALVYLGKVVGPPNQPVGAYTLIERQEGDNFFPYYTFYEGPDSVGSNGFLSYVSREHAEGRGILNVTYEYDDLDDLFHPPKTSSRNTSASSAAKQTKKPFIYMGSAPTIAGPRDSIRLEGTRRFNRGLFM